MIKAGTKFNMDDKGMTMMEVLVGFVILTIIITGVYHMIRFGSNMLYESIDMRKGQNRFEEELYKTDSDPEVVEKNDVGSASDDFILKPSGKYKASQKDIKLFSSGKEGYVAPHVCSYTYKGDFSDKFGLRVYGFE